MCFQLFLKKKKKIVGLQNLMTRNRQILKCGSASPEGFSLPFILVQVISLFFFFPNVLVSHQLRVEAYVFLSSSNIMLFRHILFLKQMFILFIDLDEVQTSR